MRSGDYSHDQFVAMGRCPTGTKSGPVTPAPPQSRSVWRRGVLLRQNVWIAAMNSAGRDACRYVRNKAWVWRSHRPPCLWDWGAKAQRARGRQTRQVGTPAATSAVGPDEFSGYILRLVGVHPTSSNAPLPSYLEMSHLSLRHGRIRIKHFVPVVAWLPSIATGKP